MKSVRWEILNRACDGHNENVKQIYNQVNLSTYIDNDPIIKQERILNDIYYQQQRLKIEIRELKNG